jgi:hypothetical protein
VYRSLPRYEQKGFAPLVQHEHLRQQGQGCGLSAAQSDNREVIPFLFGYMIILKSSANFEALAFTARRNNRYQAPRNPPISPGPQLNPFAAHQM